MNKIAHLAPAAALALSATVMLGACSNDDSLDAKSSTASTLTGKHDDVASSIDWTAIEQKQKSVQGDDAKAIATLRKGGSCLGIDPKTKVVYWFQPKTIKVGSSECETPQKAIANKRIVFALNEEQTKWMRQSTK